jgi:hypothetical protein
MSNRFSHCVAACLVLISLVPLPAFSRSGLADWSVSDSSGAVELNAAEQQDSMITVSLKNRSSEMITAVALFFKEDVYHYQDWMNAEPSGLAPGQAFEVTVGADEAANRKISISAVLFDDGSGKGDSDQLDLMNVHRFGQILEGARVRDILRNRKASYDDASMNALAQKIGKMPLSTEDALISLAGVDIPGISLANLKQSSEKTRNALLWGVSTARERAVRQIENVKHLPTVSSDEKVPSRTVVLSFLQEQYDAQNKKAAALLARMKGGR